MKYRFHNAEIGVMYEIMLPKKIQYQDFLFNTLVNGLQTFSFSKYFEENKTSVRQLFEAYSDSLSGKKFELELFDRDYTAIFQGYSMSEVYGVFRHENSTSFDEELTQIVRVYFLPDYNDICKRFPTFSTIEVYKFADNFFSVHKNMYRRRREFVDDSGSAGFGDSDTMEQQRELHNYFNYWVDAVAFFVFGYIIHEICKHLSTSYEDNKLKAVEKEIWVSSQWGVLINRTKLQE